MPITIWVFGPRISGKLLIFTVKGHILPLNKGMDVVESPSLGVFEKCVDMALKDMV